MRQAVTVRANNAEGKTTSCICLFPASIADLLFHWRFVFSLTDFPVISESLMSIFIVELRAFCHGATLFEVTRRNRL